MKYFALSLLLLFPGFCQDITIKEKPLIVTIDEPMVLNKVVYQTGTASWYGKHWKNRKTANGEKFNPNAHTCAHKTLPMNTIILVTNLENGKMTSCRINDRGPYVHNRILDMSHKVAQSISDNGLTNVLIEVIG